MTKGSRIVGWAAGVGSVQQAFGAEVAKEALLYDKLKIVPVYRPTLGTATKGQLLRVDIRETQIQRRTRCSYSK